MRSAALSRACVVHLRDACRANPGLLDYYAKTLVPEESLVQTLLVNSGRFRFSDVPLHYADTEGRRDGSARVLTRADIPAIVRSRSFFARKFDSGVDSQVLDLIDARLDRPEPAPGP